MVSPVELLRVAQITDKAQDLERDILFFYDYLLFIKVTQQEDCWLKYNGVYLNALKLIRDKNIEYPNEPIIFDSKNYITNYIKLAKMFNLDEFKHEIFAFVEVKIIRRQWRLR